MCYFFRCSHCRMPLFLFLNKHLWQQESVQRASYANQSLFCVKNVFVCFVYDFKNLFSASVLVFFPLFVLFILTGELNTIHVVSSLFFSLSPFLSLSLARSLTCSHTFLPFDVSVWPDKRLVNFPIHKNFTQNFWVSIKIFRSSFLFGLIE